MSEYTNRLNIPDYVSIKEAAKILGISDKRVYEYVDEGRLPGMWAADVIMIPLQAVKEFKRKSSGRPRKNVPVWRVSSGDNLQFMTSVFVQIREGMEDAFLQKLEEIRQSGQHNFPGTVARFIVESETTPGQVEISLIWRSTVMPNQMQQRQFLQAFQDALGDVLDWNSSHIHYGKVLMHT